MPKKEEWYRVEVFYDVEDPRHPESTSGRTPGLYPEMPFEDAQRTAGILRRKHRDESRVVIRVKRSDRI